MISAACFTILINLSKEPWNSDDAKQQRIASKRCEKLFKDAPCLKEWIKVEPGVYRALCGGVDGKSRQITSPID